MKANVHLPLLEAWMQMEITLRNSKEVEGIKKMVEIALDGTKTQNTGQIKEPKESIL